MLQPPLLTENEAVSIVKSCTVCRSSSFLPLYKCNMGGHIICFTCFSKLPKSGGARCSQCNSVFLKMHSYSGTEQMKHITVEDLFQLPKDQVNLLLNKGSKQIFEPTGNIAYENAELENTLKKINSETTLHMFKPFKCPHIPCGKTVNTSSLKTHYIYEHPDITTYLIKRGEELCIETNTAIIEYGMTYCIGMIQVYGQSTIVSHCDGGYKKLHDKKSIAVFWILVSGSKERDYSKAFALYWLVTDSENPFKCTLEVSSSSNATSFATFCGVNNIRDDLSSSAIADTMNCLYLSYGTLRSVKGEWGEICLRLIIH